MIVIKVDTGFQGGEYTYETGLTVVGWMSLSQDEKNKLFDNASREHIATFAYDDDTDEYIE